MYNFLARNGLVDCTCLIPAIYTSRLSYGENSVDNHNLKSKQFNWNTNVKASYICSGVFAMSLLPEYVSIFPSQLLQYQYSNFKMPCVQSQGAESFCFFSLHLSTKKFVLYLMGFFSNFHFLFYIFIINKSLIVYLKYKISTSKILGSLVHHQTNIYN